MPRLESVIRSYRKSIKNNKVAYPGGLAGRLSGGSAVQIRGLPELRDQLDKINSEARGSGQTGRIVPENGRRQKPLVRSGEIPCGGLSVLG